MQTSITGTLKRLRVDVTIVMLLLEEGTQYQRNGSA
jgi:hypothetical protein